jgi:TonB-linked SusC/RagA family outer membrane protein
MKRYLLLYIFIITGLSSQILLSQTRIITGKVVSAADSLGLPGVTVVVKGTQIGAITNIDGFYSLEVPVESDSLVFSFVGMQSQTLPVFNKNMINVALSPQLYEVNEVVVTALGIRRASKALGYSATSVSSEDLTEGRDRSMLNSLQGKVAGVNVSSASGAPGASSRILLRGISSLGGSNQPLFVIDGVPVNNGYTGSTSINGGTDFGNKMNDLNPDDIENISILKGASGSALYGSRAANGVIIITTKKGENIREKKKAEITVSSSVSFEEHLRTIKYQNEFGQGIYGDAVNYENMSWGPKFDSKLHYWGYEVDNTLRVKPYIGLTNNVREFFDTGENYNNSISISGGNEQTTYYLSYSNVMHDGIFPTNSDSYNRHTISARGTHITSSRLSSSYSINYIKKNNKSVPTGQGENSVYNQVMQTPRDISLLELEDIDSKWNNLDNYYSLYTVNPYFILKKNGNTNNEDRIYGSIDLDYKFADPLSLKIRLGGDVSNEQLKQWRAVIEPGGNNEFAAVFEPGRVSESSAYVMQLNSDLLLNYSKEFGDFSIDAIIGHNLNQRTAKGISASVNDLTIPGFFQLKNSSETPFAGESFVRRRLIGVFSSLDLSYKSIVFVTMTARNDWSSTLPVKNNSFFYPGINASLIFTELVPGVKKFFPYGKIRAALTRVGNDAPAYSVHSVFVTGGHSDGYGFLRYPLPNGVNSFEVSNLIGNEDLKPELTTEFEIGTDLRFFNNRLGIDFSYYDKNTTNLIWPAPLPTSSGYSSKTINLGKMTNKGVEALLNITPVQLTSFQWDISLNFTKNKNMLVELTEELERIEITGLAVEGGQQINFIAKPGRTVGIFEGREVMHDPQGRIVVDNTGLPKAAEDLVEYGDREYDYVAGISTRLTWKGISISGTLDIRQGGIMYSRTKDISVWAGTVPITLYNMREPFIIPNSVYEIGRDINNEPIYAENTIPIDAVHLVDYWGNGGTQLDGISFIDKSYIKLREVILSYSVPEKLLSQLPIGTIQLSVIGRNLLLWTPEDQHYIDPELTTFGNDLEADFGEYGAQPTVRSVTFSLRFSL